jgi:hypothetical protein
MTGNRSVSLNAGTTTDKSIVLGSFKDVRESGLLGDLKHLYFFSESRVMMGGGDQKTSAVYACSR